MMIDVLLGLAALIFLVLYLLERDLRKFYKEQADWWMEDSHRQFDRYLAVQSDYMRLAMSRDEK